MPARFNINDTVRIEVTKVGEKLWLEHYATLSEDGVETSVLKRDIFGKTEMQLWEVMHIFGPGCFNGADVPFKPEIELL